MPKRLRLKFTACLLIVALTGLCGCGKSSQTTAGNTKGSQSIPVRVIKAESRDVPRIISAIGSVQPERTVAIRSRVDGAIQSIHFQEGDTVKTGDLLVKLDQGPYLNHLKEAEADLLTAQAESAQAQADLDRYTTLFKQQGVSKEQLMQITTGAERASATVKAKEAAVANARLDLEYTSILAPFSGRTGQILLHEGTLVRAGDANGIILTINQIAPIAVSFSIPEKDLDSVKNALAKGPVVVTALSKQDDSTSSKGRLTFIDNTADRTTGTILLKATFTNEDMALWPGRFVDVQINLGLDIAQTVIPSVAIQMGQNGNQVFVVKPDQKADLRQIEVVRTFGDYSIIGKGVTAGENVVIEGQFRLVPDATVTIRPPATPTGASQNPASSN